MRSAPYHNRKRGKIGNCKWLHGDGDAWGKQCKNEKENGLRVKFSQPSLLAASFLFSVIPSFAVSFAHLMSNTTRLDSPSCCCFKHKINQQTAFPPNRPSPSPSPVCILPTPLCIISKSLAQHVVGDQLVHDLRLRQRRGVAQLLPYKGGACEAQHMTCHSMSDPSNLHNRGVDPTPPPPSTQSHLEVHVLPRGRHLAQDAAHQLAGPVLVCFFNK